MADKIEREYIIPLRREWNKVPRYKRAAKAIKAIKEFLVRHMKIYDKDLKKIKIDKYLNEEIWFRGIRKPPAKIKVKAVREAGTDEVKVELVDYLDKLKFKKAREEKIEQKSVEASEAKKTKEKLEEKTEEEKPKEKTEEESKETRPSEAELKKEETKKEEEKEKKAAVVESMEKMEKEIAKKTKHQAKEKVKQPKHQQRKALAK